MFRLGIGHSNDIDTEGAVAEALEGCRNMLGETTPQAGLVFAAISFDHRLILAKIREAFPGIELIGCTTDGELSSELGFQEDSVVILLLHAEGVEIRAGVGKGLSKGIREAACEAVRSARSRCSLPPRLCITSPESMTASGVSMVKALEEELGEGIPIFGGVAGDQWRFEKTYQFFNDEVLTDSVPLLLLAGPVRYAFGVASGWSPIGKSGEVTKSEGNVVQEVDGKSALDYFRHYLGEHVTPSGETPLAVFDSDNDSSFYLRAPLAYDQEAGSISFAGDIPTGCRVQIAQARRDDILHGTRASITMAKDGFRGAEPEVALLFSCAARKQLLGTRTREEVGIFRELFSGKIPVAGWYCYGEICPLRSGDSTYFHNETIVTLLLGTP